MSDELCCALCGTALTFEVMACPGCDVVLASTVTSRTDPSLVRALLSPPEWSWSQEVTPKAVPFIHEQVTARTLILDEDTCPRVVADIDLALRPLPVFEAKVVSLLDGRTSVAQIVRTTRLALVEVRAVLYSLLERRVIELAPSAPQRQVPRKTSQEADDENVLEHVISLERDGDIERAIDLLSRAIARSSRPAPLYNKLALILLNQRQAFHPAEALLKKAIRLEPDNLVYGQNLARLIRLAGPR